MPLESTPAQASALIASFVVGYVWKSYGRRILNGLRQVAVPKNTKLVLVVRTDLHMSAGKVASQCSHAAVSCYKQALATDPMLLRAWEAQGQPKIVLRARTPGELALTGLAEKASHNGLIAMIVRDAGRTEVAKGSATVLGIGPGDAKVISSITDSYRTL